LAILSNRKQLRDTLDLLKTRDIILPVWDQTHAVRATTLVPAIFSAGSPRALTD
jgi:hypothetical protein